MKTAVIMMLAVVFTACSSSPTRPVFSDFMEIRELQTDDPLTLTFQTREGEEVRLGDPVISGKNVSRFQVKENKDGEFELHITLTGAMDARWRRFSRSRGRQAALVVDGMIRSIFDVQNAGPPVENELLVVTIPDVATSLEDAEALDSYLENSKTKKKKITD
ncbi:MAG: hypothetical protein C0600_06820 [Ignavibacteria bacterium]|nr:MAG: hypothetical protein C0600_06820 [Ignavibacteria bacterium]